MNLRNNKL